MNRNASRAQYMKQYLDRRMAEGRCTICNAAELATKRYCASCLEKVLASDRIYAAKLKRRIFGEYGDRCSCCGESDPRFLSIDHSNDDGHEMRKIHGVGTKFYRWIIRNNFPEDLRLLCYNCNIGRSLNGGVCPHKTESS
jgi:hypothetical protein